MSIITLTDHIQCWSEHGNEAIRCNLEGNQGKVILQNIEEPSSVTSHGLGVASRGRIRRPESVCGSKRQFGIESAFRQRPQPLSVYSMGACRLLTLLGFNLNSLQSNRNSKGLFSNLNHGRL